MPDYCFYQKGKQTIVLDRSEVDCASELMKQGYEKQFEEVNATNKKNALARFAEIRRNDQIDHNNFLAGAGSLPLIGWLTAIAISLIRKK